MEIDIKLGDILLGGRFKNKRIAVKRLGTDDLGQPSMNSRPLLNYRIEKKLPVSKQSSKTREGKMEKSAEEAYQFGFQDELEKVAKARPLSRAVAKLHTLLKGKKPRPLSPSAFQAKYAVPPTREMFIPGVSPTPRQLKRIDRKMLVADLRFERTRAEELPLFLRKGLGPKGYL